MPQHQASDCTDKCSTASESPMVYNVVNPHTTTWQQLLPSFQKMCATPLEAVSFREWFEELRKEAGQEGEIENLPAIRLLDFFEGFLQPPPTHRSVLSTSEAVKHSLTMAKLEPVSERWIETWMRQWEFLG